MSRDDEQFSSDWRVFSGREVIEYIMLANNAYRIRLVDWLFVNRAVVKEASFGAGIFDSYLGRGTQPIREQRERNCARVLGISS